MGRGVAIITIGILFAAIIRASSKIADQFSDNLANGDWPHLPNGWGVDGPTETGGGAVPNESGRLFETHNVMFRTHDGDHN